MGKFTYNPEKDIPDLSGKVFLITGGTSGLGAAIVQYLAAHNPKHIFFTGRAQIKADDVVASVKQSSPNTAVTFIRCDHGSLADTQAAARTFLAQSDRLDVLICNAGVMAIDPALSPDGYEIQFAVNELSHALLVKLLLPTLLRTAAEPGADVRVVHTSSVAHAMAPTSCGIDVETLRTTQSGLGGPLVPGPRWSRYAQSKLASIVYAAALAEQHPEITSVSVHPGVIPSTGIFNGVPLFGRITALIATYMDRVPEEIGSYTQLWAATIDKSKLTNGEFYGPIGVVADRRTKWASDPELRKKLSDWTEKELKDWSL